MRYTYTIYLIAICNISAFSQSRQEKQVLKSTQSFMSTFLRDKAQLTQITQKIKFSYETKNFALYKSVIDKSSYQKISSYQNLLLNGDSLAISDEHVPLVQQISIISIRSIDPINQNKFLQSFKPDFIENAFKANLKNKRFTGNLDDIFDATSLEIGDSTAKMGAYHFVKNNNTWRVLDPTLDLILTPFLKIYYADKEKHKADIEENENDLTTCIKLFQNELNKDLSKIVWKPIKSHP